MGISLEEAEDRIQHASENKAPTLNLSDCEVLQDLSPLARLATLQVLDLSWCAQVVDLSPLTNLTMLKTLDLNWCSMVSDLSPLTPLTALHTLNLFECEEVSDLSPLSGLIGLRTLDLALCDQVEDLEPLSSLINLEHLDLTYCGKSLNFEPLTKLSALQILHLRGPTLPLDCHPTHGVLRHWPELQLLTTDNLKSAPNELASTSWDDDCLPRIQAWQDDLLDGEADNNELKVFVLGNGGAGKTQICRRLRGEAFDASIESTHGIQIGRVELWPATANEKGLIANLWDFGGQDIYHGTHALFMDERAVYVVVWNPELEQAGEYQEQGVAMQHRQLAYWLAMVRSTAGEDAAMIVVQSQCDEQHLRTAPPLPAEHGFKHLQTTTSSALKARGIDGLLVELRNQAELLQERFGKVLLPASWVAVAERLRQLRDKGSRTLPMEAFEQECRASHAGAPPSVVLQYLHRSGTVFWRDGLFNNEVILDQQWALDGVYSALDRQRSLPLLRRMGGQLDRDLLDDLIWRGHYTLGEQRLFLSLMQQCDACFVLNYDRENRDNHRYLALDGLPDKNESSGKLQQYWPGGEPDLLLQLDYPFLHEGIMKGLISRIGWQAGVDALYWRYGVCFYDARLQARLRLEALPDTDPEQPGAGRILLAAKAETGCQLQEVAAWLERLAEDLQRQDRCQQASISRPRWLEDAPARLENQREQLPALEQVQPAPFPPQPGERSFVYLSYGWSDANFALVERLQQAFATRGWELKFDRNEMRTGDWISDFMREIGRSPKVLMLLDEKYLKSAYCMRELLYLWQASLGDKQEFLHKILPCVLEEIPLATASGRFPYRKHWKQKQIEHETLEREMAELGMSWHENAPETREEILLVRDFCHRTDEMLAWIADPVMPRLLANIEKDNFQPIFDLLEAQGLSIRPPDNKT